MFPCVLLLGFPFFFFFSLWLSQFFCLQWIKTPFVSYLPASALPHQIYNTTVAVCSPVQRFIWQIHIANRQVWNHTHTHRKKKRGSLTSKKDWNTHTDLKHNCLGSGHAMPLKITFVWFTCCLSCMLDPDKTSIWKVCEPSVTLQNRYTGTWCNQLTFYTLPVMKIVLTCLSTSACCCAKAGIKRAWSK